MIGFLRLATLSSLLLLRNWLGGARLLVFLVLLESIIFISAILLCFALRLGGEILILFIASGGVLGVLLLIVTSSTRKFGLYAREVCECKLYRLPGSYPGRAINCHSWNMKFFSFDWKGKVPSNFDVPVSFTASFFTNGDTGGGGKGNLLSQHTWF